MNRDIVGNWAEQSVIRKVRRIAKDQGVYVNDSKEFSGYDRQFIMLQQGRKLVEDVEEFIVPENATTRQLAKAFSKYGDSKKKSRIITRKFAEIIA